MSGTWSKKCFKMSLVEGLGARNATRCLWQRHVEQEMLQDEIGRGTWSKKCFKMKQLELGARHASRRLWQRHLEQDSRCLWQRHLEQEMLQDVSGRGRARNASRQQDMLQDVSGRGTWSKMSLAEALGQKFFKMSLAEALGACPLTEPHNVSRCLWQSHLEQDVMSSALPLRASLTEQEILSRCVLAATTSKMPENISEPLGARNASRCL